MHDVSSMCGSLQLLLSFFLELNIIRQPVGWMIITMFESYDYYFYYFYFSFSVHWEGKNPRNERFFIYFFFFLNFNSSALRFISPKVPLHTDTAASRIIMRKIPPCVRAHSQKSSYMDGYYTMMIQVNGSFSPYFFFSRLENRDAAVYYNVT